MLKLNCFVGHATSADVATTVPVPEEVEAVLKTLKEVRLFYSVSKSEDRSLKRLVSHFDGRCILYPVRGDIHSVVMLFYSTEREKPVGVVFAHTKRRLFSRKRKIVNVCTYDSEHFSELVGIFLEWFEWLRGHRQEGC